MAHPPAVIAMADLCAEHAWASIGVTVFEGHVSRIWACEHCPAWTGEPLDREFEIDWDDTWLSGM